MKSEGKTGGRAGGAELWERRGWRGLGTDHVRCSEVWMCSEETLWRYEQRLEQPGWRSRKSREEIHGCPSEEPENLPKKNKRKLRLNIFFDFLVKLQQSCAESLHPSCWWLLQRNSGVLVSFLTRLLLRGRPDPIWSGYWTFRQGIDVTIILDPIDHEWLYNLNKKMTLYTFSVSFLEKDQNSRFFFQAAVCVHLISCEKFPWFSIACFGTMMSNNSTFNI